MIYQIALCATLLFLAMTGLPDVRARSDQFGAKQQAVEPRQVAPRTLEVDKPKFIDVRASDASLNEIAKWLSQSFELNAAPREKSLPIWRRTSG